MEERPSVLVVDDNEDLLQTFSLILKRRGFNVDTAENGAAAVDKFKAHPVDVILMDIVMPEMNGVEAFRKIREISPRAKVILMTAYSEEELIEIALSEGAHRVVHKPLRVDQMIERGLVAEVTRLLDMGYSANLPAMSSIGYRQIGRHLRGELTLESAIQQIKFETHRIVRHQYNWFRLRDNRILWFDIKDEVEPEVTELVARFLSK